MHKVMTRAQRRPGARPPGRHDARRPGGAPPRTPGTTRPPGPPRASGSSRPPGPAPASGSSRPPGPAQASGSSRPPGPPRTPADSRHPGPARPSTGVRSAPHPVTSDLFADRLLAVLSGQRPVHWMLRHTAGRAYDELARLAERGLLRTRGVRPVVRDIGYYEARPDALEVFARIGAGDQLRALAFRLEQGKDHRWRCTAIELGTPRP
ncbi:Rv3235 family protein [Streptomyces sp. NPDC014748]|uniref:Rv3235 family protein n=1 Tax=Streptomyces sp. NPDC014748 TaxID=3364905 RepID=UPI0036F81521